MIMLDGGGGGYIYIFNVAVHVCWSVFVLTSIYSNDEE